MTILARGLLAACAFGLSSLTLAADGAASGPFLKGDAKAGEGKAAVCSACHGPGGNSANPIWPSLAGQGAPYTYAQLKAFKAGERQDPVMSAQAQALSDQDMQDLAVYFASQTPKPGVASEQAVAVAQKLYRAGDAERAIPACSGCHGPAGTGNPAAAYPHLAGQQPDYAAKALKAYRGGERKTGKNGQIMAEVAAKLTDEEIAALASYLHGLQ